MIKITMTEEERKLRNAAAIIEGFLSVYEMPTCIEQQIVVESAMRWLMEVKNENI
jgi:hypothetical protein